MNERKKLLKVLNKDLTSPYRNYQYELGKDYNCPDFDDSDNECSRGFYAVGWDGLSYAYRHGKNVVFEVEVWGKEKEFSPFKRRYENQKIIRQLSDEEVKQGLKEASEEAGYDLYHGSFPHNPLTGAPQKPEEKDVENLKKWNSVWDSVWDSALAYISGLFPNVKNGNTSTTKKAKTLFSHVLIFGRLDLFRRLTGKPGGCTAVKNLKLYMKWR